MIKTRLSSSTRPLFSKSNEPLSLSLIPPSHPRRSVGGHFGSGKPRGKENLTPADDSSSDRDTSYPSSSLPRKPTRPPRFLSFALGNRNSAGGLAQGSPSLYNTRDENRETRRLLHAATRGSQFLRETIAALRAEERSDDCSRKVEKRKEGALSKKGLGGS